MVKKNNNSTSMLPIPKEEEESLEMDTMQALLKAKEAFNQHLEDLGYDPAYWDIRFTAWEVDSNFEHRLTKIEIEGEVKNEH